MKTLSKSDIQQWIEARGIESSAAGSGTAGLEFSSGERCQVCWSVPTDLSQRSYFLDSVLTAASETDVWLAWRPYGAWPNVEPPTLDDSGLIEHALLGGLGLPLGTNDGVLFEPSDYANLLGLLFCTLAFGWSLGEDVFVVAGESIIYVSHHDKVYVLTGEASALDRVRAQMECRGFGECDTAAAR